MSVGLAPLRRAAVEYNIYNNITIKVQWQNTSMHNFIKLSLQHSCNAQNHRSIYGLFALMDGSWVHRVVSFFSSIVSVKGRMLYCYFNPDDSIRDCCCNSVYIRTYYIGRRTIRFTCYCILSELIKTIFVGQCARRVHHNI